MDTGSRTASVELSTGHGDLGIEVGCDTYFRTVACILFRYQLSARCLLRCRYLPCLAFLLHALLQRRDKTFRVGIYHVVRLQATSTAVRAQNKSKNWLPTATVSMASAIEVPAPKGGQKTTTRDKRGSTEFTASSQNRSKGV
jgi:hypothetical protein